MKIEDKKKNTEKEKPRLIKNTRYFSKKIGELPEGCKRCVKGEKVVIYITGICPRNCWYCPLSEKKKNKDVVFADEWKINKENIDDKNFYEIVEEAKLINATGAGITGGDPLSRLDRTILVIKLLKNKFGKNFHIHLYTSFNLVNEKSIERLYKAGLDEIRFHPDFDYKDNWKNIAYALKYNWDVGIEIPVIPDKEETIKEIIDYFDSKVKFINLNQFEISDTNADALLKRNYIPVSDESSAIKGSYKTAKKILTYALKKHLNVHFCTSKLKDAIQMKNRLIRRAKNIATKFDKITDEGLLLRGGIYGDLNKIKEYLKKIDKEFYKDKKNNKIVVETEFIEKNYKKLKRRGFKPAIVEEYPTWDADEVVINYL